MADAKKPEEKKVEQTNTQPAPEVASSAPAQETKTNGLAVAALVLAFFIPLVGLIMGIIALSTIKKSGEGGKGLAKAAIIVASIIMLFWVLFIGIWVFAIGNAVKDSGVNVSNGNVSVQGKDGESATFGTNAKLPEGFPSDVPIYEPSDIIASATTKKDSYTVSLLTRDDVSKVSSFYDSKLPSNGWVKNTDGGEINYSGGSLQTYTKGSQTLGLLIASDNNSDDYKTSVTITVTSSN